MQGNTDEEDRISLHSFHPSEVDRILEVKHNVATDLELRSTNSLDEQAWNCLGCILGTNTSVTKLDVSLCDLDVSWLCAGLQYNQNITEFRFFGIDLGGVRAMNSLAPFLSNNPSLKEINLFYCRIGQASIDILANAIMNQAADTLERIGLGSNLGDCNLDELLTALSACPKLISLSLDRNGIGQRVCNSLAQLLKSPESNLKYLHLKDNLIDEEGIDILKDSLSNNTKLRILDLPGNSRITRSGWQSLLKLVCDASSMTTVKESNHILNCLGIYGDEMKAKVISALGVDDANLLFASLELNEKWSWRRKDNAPSIIRQKMIWAHAARGGINIADSDIPDGVMPVILSWFGDYSSEKTAHLIKYHDPPLSQKEVNTKRLDSFYRIVLELPLVLERPLKLCENRQPNVDDVSQLTDTLAHTSLG